MRARIHDLRQKALAELREATRLEKEGLRKTLENDRMAARLLKDEAQKRKAEYLAEKKYQREMRETERRYLGKEKIAVTAHDRKQESDDATRANLPPDLVPLFNRMKGQFKATGRKSRSEMVLEYAESHPGEVIEILEGKTDSLIRDLEAREKEARKALRTSPVLRKKYTAAELAETPF